MSVEIRGTENSIAVPSLIAMESLYRLKDHLVLPKIANHSFDSYFEEQIGDTITIKRPYRAKVAKGRKIAKQPMIDKTIDVTVNGRYNFALEYTDTNKTLDIVDFGKRYLDTGSEELAYKYDIDGAEELATGLFHMNGVPGTALSLRESQFIRAHATKVAIPENSQNFALLDPLDIAEISADIQEVDMPEMVGQNIKRSYRGMLAGWSVMGSVHVPYLEVAAVPVAAAPLVRSDQAGASVRGNTLTTDGWTNAGAVVLNKGQLIQIAGVDEIQPRGNRRKTGNPATFVITADATPNANGQVTLNIYPDINAGTADDVVVNPSGVDVDAAAQANLDASAFQTVSAVPADNAVITVIGRDTDDGNAKTYRQGLYFVGDALEYVNVTLTDFDSAVKSGVEMDEETGVSISYLCDFDIDNRTEAERLDIFFGVKAIYPEVGMRHVGAEV